MTDKRFSQNKIALKKSKKSWADQMWSAYIGVKIDCIVCDLMTLIFWISCMTLIFWNPPNCFFSEIFLYRDFASSYI